MVKYRNGGKKKHDTTEKTTQDVNIPEATTDDSECENENCKTESETLVQCEKCKLWLCCNCQSISPNMLKAIKQFNSLQWFCKTCKPEVLQSEPKEIQKSVECRLQTMKDQLAKLSTNIRELGVKGLEV